MAGRQAPRAARPRGRHENAGASRIGARRGPRRAFHPRYPRYPQADFAWPNRAKVTVSGRGRTRLFFRKRREEATSRRRSRARLFRKEERSEAESGGEPEKKREAFGPNPLSPGRPAINAA